MSLATNLPPTVQSYHLVNAYRQAVNDSYVNTIMNGSNPYLNQFSHSSSLSSVDDYFNQNADQIIESEVNESAAKGTPFDLSSIDPNDPSTYTNLGGSTSSTGSTGTTISDKITSSDTSEPTISDNEKLKAAILGNENGDNVMGTPYYQKSTENIYDTNNLLIIPGSIGSGNGNGDAGGN